MKRYAEKRRISYYGRKRSGAAIRFYLPRGRLGQGCKRIH